MLKSERKDLLEQVRTGWSSGRAIGEIAEQTGLAVEKVCDMVHILTVGKEAEVDFLIGNLSSAEIGKLHAKYVNGCKQIIKPLSARAMADRRPFVQDLEILDEAHRCYNGEGGSLEKAADKLQALLARMSELEKENERLRRLPLIDRRVGERRQA